MPAGAHILHMYHVCSSEGACCVFYAKEKAYVGCFAEFPGKSEHVQKEKEGGWEVQMRKKLKGRGAGERIRREEREAAGERGRQSFRE